MPNPHQNKSQLTIISAKGRDTFSLEQQKRLEHHSIKFIQSTEKISNHDLIKLLHKAQIVGLTPRSTVDFGEEIFSQLPNLKGLAVFSTGKEWVDLHAAEKYGVNVRFLQNYSTNTVAEHALASMLNFSRKLHISTLGREESKSISKQGFELAGKTLGIIGMGKIGSRLATICKGLDMKIIYSDDDDKSTDEHVTMEQLLNRSDVIAMTASGNRTRQAILESKHFELMKKVPLLINVARSYLIDTTSMISALKNKQISGYAVDDYLDIEVDEEIRTKILQTGHTAWYSREAIARGTDEWVQNLIDLADQNNIP